MWVGGGEGRCSQSGERVRGEEERGGWGEADGSIFQAPRAKKLEQETGKGLPSNPNTVMVVVVLLAGFYLEVEGYFTLV